MAEVITVSVGCSHGSSFARLTVGAVGFFSEHLRFGPRWRRPWALSSKLQ